MPIKAEATLKPESDTVPGMNMPLLAINQNLEATKQLRVLEKNRVDHSQFIRAGAFSNAAGSG